MYVIYPHVTHAFSRHIDNDQLVGDSLDEARTDGLDNVWTGIIGNPAKFGLGLVSIFFDVSIQMHQKSYCCCKTN